jgi:hypothetical protein
VKDVKRLDKASFIKSLVINIIEASTTLLFILRHGTKDKKVNLILFNIIIIKGFLINIVLKTLLYKKGLWIYSLDIMLHIRSK